MRVVVAGKMGYLKRYEPQYLMFAKLLQRALHWPGADDEALREWRKMLLLRQHGFLIAEPIAVGQRRRCGAVVESFLLQLEIAGGMPADEYFRQRLAGEPPVRRRRLIGQIGALARRFQQAGFIHKDLYFKHVFVVERGAEWDLYLIDLQRVLGPGRHRHRWHLKDLGALAHSGQARAGLSRTDLLRLYFAFAEVKRLGPADKRLIGQIWKRVRRIRSRQPKYKRVWNAPSPTTV